MRRSHQVVFLAYTLSLVLVGLVSLFTALQPATAADTPEGQAIFTGQKCNMCHSVSTVGIEATVKVEAMKGPDLVNIVADQDAEHIKKYLRQEVKIDDKNHKKKVTLSDEEFTKLIAWLQEQKK